MTKHHLYRHHDDHNHDPRYHTVIIRKLVTDESFQTEPRLRSSLVAGDDLFTATGY